MTGVWGEQVYVKAGAPIGNTNATKRNRVTGLNDELVVKEEEVAPGVFVDSGIAHHIRKLNLAGFKTFGSDSSMKSDHPKHDAKQKGAPYIMFDNPSKSQLSEISKSASKSAGSVSPPGPGWKYAQVTFDKGSDKEISETFDKFTNHLVGSNLSASLASRIETLLARDNRPTYYATDQPELHNAVRDRAQAIYQRAVDRSVD